ncbi:MAG: DNA mismatch repair endonuclease MutL [Terriglobia bacterium]
MSVIHILPEAVANQIAAGEVVERPASIVKELLENSIDAGAGRVEVAVEAGGKRLIRVTDDGCGMTHDDALLAFERHATSKIRSAEDLFAIISLGFRGEALPSIAAVSRLLLETRHASESAGTRLEIAGGRLRDVKEMAWPGGTRIEVRDVFFNTPARRKFLKSESTELGHIATLLTHYALAHPEKSFRLASLSNEILNVSPVAGTRERIYQVMGGKLLEQLVEVAPRERAMIPATEWVEEEDASEPVAAPAVPIVKVHGFVSRPEVQKLNRNSIYFFVNRRLVRDRLILHAITEATRNILPPSVFPVALIFLELPASEVDVNVHPSKMEVRFRHSGFIHDFVRDSIRQALVASRPVAAFPAGRRTGIPMEEEVEVAEKLSEESPLAGGAYAGLGGRDSEGGSREGGRGFVPRPPASALPSARASDFLLTPPQPEPYTERLPLEAPPAPSGTLPSIRANIPFDAPPAFSQATAGTRDSAATPPGSSDAAAAGVDEFPTDLRPLGQVQESFIVATNAQGLWIVDQHVAHERVLFERHLRQRLEKKLEGQRLLLPIIVELKPDQEVTFHEIAAELAANGFDVEPFGQRTVAIKTAPADVRADDADRLLIEILDGVGREARAISLDELRGKIAASVACHAAIKINMPLERSKMEWLLDALAKTQYPMTCPHGRPIVLRYSLKDIHKAFKRI